MKFIENYCDAYVSNSSLYGYSIRNLFNNSTIYIIPIINPYGLVLFNKKKKKNSTAYRKAVSISNDFPQLPFPSGWKANINGVDFKNYQPIYKVL